MIIKVPNRAFSNNKDLVDLLLKNFPKSHINLKGMRFRDEALVKFLYDAEAAIIGLELINNDLLDKLPKLKFIAKYGVGLNNIDLEACKKRNIMVGWSPGVNKRSVAEMTLGFMLSLSRNLFTTSNQLKSSIWNKNGGYQLSNKTVGIIGLGNIGKEVVKLLKPFQCNILVNDILNIEDFSKKNNLKIKSKEEIYRESDIISVHTPLTNETNNLINKEAFSLMKSTSLIINTARARLTRAVNVGNHELLHGILRKSMKKGQISDKLINNLKVKFGKQWSVVEAKVLAVDKNGVRLYDNAYLKQNPDEWITMLSDAIQNNEITFDDSVFTKIGDLIAPILRLAGFKKIGFENAQSTYNFLKEYNRSIHKGSLSKSIIKKTGGDVSKIGGDKAKFSMSTDNTSAINELAGMGWTNQSWKEQGADFAIKEMQSNKMLDGLIRSKYKADIVPDNFVDLVYSELVSHVKNFKPESNDSLFGWVNSQIANKAGNVYNREFKVDDEMKGAKDIGKTTKEGEVKVQVAAETDSRMEALETEDLSPAAQAKKKADKAKGKEKVESKFRRQIGIETGSDLYNKVLDTARKSLLRAYEAGTSVRNIQRKLRDEANVYLFKDIKNFLGTKDYIKRLKEFRVPIMNSIFTADLVQMERNTPEGERVFTRFVRKLTSKADVQAAVDQNLLPASALNIIDKGTAVSLYEKANPTEAQFMSYFDIPTINPKTGARSGTRGTRKDQLAKNMAGALSYDATMEVAQEPEIAQKRADLAELRGESLLADDISQLAAAINRNPSVKFSYSQKQFDQGISIIEGNNKNDGFGGVNWNNFFNNPDISNDTKNAAQEAYAQRLTEQNDAISNKDLAKYDFTDPKRNGSYTGKPRKRKLATSKKYELYAKEKMQEALKNAGLDAKVYKVEKLSEKDNNPDIRVTRSGKTIFTVEIKGNTARGVSVSFNYKQDGKGLAKNKK